MLQIALKVGIQIARYQTNIDSQYEELTTDKMYSIVKSILKAIQITFLTMNKVIFN